MKFTFIFIFILTLTNIKAQESLSTEIRYDSTGKFSTIAINETYDFVFKCKANSILKNKKPFFKTRNSKKSLFLFSCENKNKRYNIDFYIDTTKQVYKKDYLLQEHYIELQNNYFLRIITTNTNDSINEIINNNLFVDFKKFITQNVDKPSKIIKLLNSFFPKDYNKQLNILNESIKFNDLKDPFFLSFFVDINTNNGTFQNAKKHISKRRKYDFDYKKIRTNDVFIDSIAEVNDIIMFNEFHAFPHTRFNFMYYLKLLKDKGFEYLALETLPAPEENDILITEPEKISGYYVEEPTCSLMINYALGLGYKLVAYEEADQCLGKGNNCRDSIQAVNILKLIEEYPKSKVVVFGGHAHIEKREREDAWKFMRVFLQEFLPEKKIISIGQTKFITTNLNSIDLDISKPVILSIDDGQFDAQIISPYYKNYYEWYYKNSFFMNKKVEIPYKKEFYEIEIIPIINNKEIYYPIFKCKKENLQGNYIYIPKEINYKVILKENTNKRL